MIIGAIAAAALPMGCSKRPEGVMSDNEMASLMADMQMAEAYGNVANNHRGLSFEEREKLGDRVLASHGVTRQQLDTSLAWYGRNLDTYSELYAKVDKQIISRRKKLTNEDSEEGNHGDNLWTSPSHSLISDLAASDGLSFNIPVSDIEKGERLAWSMVISRQQPLAVTLGVVYDNGTLSYINRSFTGDMKVKLELQTDSARKVKNVYGSLRLNHVDAQPLMIDSISLMRMPLDSMSYGRIHSQKRYYGPHRKSANSQNPEPEGWKRYEPPTAPPPGKAPGRPSPSNKAPQRRTSPEANAKAGVPNMKVINGK